MLRINFRIDVVRISFCIKKIRNNIRLSPNAGKIIMNSEKLCGQELYPEKVFEEFHLQRILNNNLC